MITTQTIAVAPRTADLGRVQIGHALVHAVTFTEAVSIVIELAKFPLGSSYVVTPNAQHIVLLESNPYFREIYNHATLAIPDGASILMAARLLGKFLPERVAGVDLFQGVCKRAAKTDIRVFLLGGRPGCAARAAEKLKTVYPGLSVAGTLCPPLGFEKDQEQLLLIEKAIRQARPHVLFVALGAPKQEYWIYDRGLKLGVPVCIGVGGSFEMVSGDSPRAPRWLRRAGFEWLFRLVHEPRRLWRRYLIGNVQFLGIVLWQLVKRAEYSKDALLGIGQRR